MFGRLYGMTTAGARARADELIETFGLTEAAARAVSTYCGGMRRRLDIAARLIRRPACCSWTSRRPGSTRGAATRSGRACG